MCVDACFCLSLCHVCAPCAPRRSSARPLRTPCVPHACFCVCRCARVLPFVSRCVLAHPMCMCVWSSTVSSCRGCTVQGVTTSFLLMDQHSADPTCASGSPQRCTTFRRVHTPQGGSTVPHWHGLRDPLGMAICHHVCPMFEVFPLIGWQVQSVCNRH